MSEIELDPSALEKAGGRARELLRAHQEQIYRRTDHLFATLMVFQWLAGIAAALWISPRAWAGRTSHVHLHVWAAIFLGGAISSFPIALAFLRPGKAFTRYTIAAAQMLYSALLIHLTGGRIETHFHVFGSLAFLAFYRDWTVLIPATAVVAVDHMVRGIYFPQSVFGVLTASPWRWVEHAGWVLFEDGFLVRSCIRSVREMGRIAERQSKLEAISDSFERKVLERTSELKASEERTRSIVDTALDGVITMDERGLITGWNAQAERIFGWLAEEALGRDMAEMIIPPKYREAHHRGLKRFLETGEGPVLNKRIEISALRRNGEEFPVGLAICPLKLAEGWIFSAFVSDITARKRAEAELQKAKEDAEAANRAKSEFLANMSHEIRTPMNGIIGMTELALDTELDPEQRDYLNTVKVSAESMLTVINDVLDFSKIEARKLDLESVEFNLRDLLGDTMKAAAVRAHQKSLELAFYVAPDVPEVVVGDPSRLRQIIVNLVGNAIKFTDEGEVVIRVETESREENAASLHFAVTDTGIGIPPEKQRVIFDAFSQADTSTTRKYGGTGLGLSISLRLVEMMKGRIWIESEAAKGSTFHFTARLGVLKGVPARLAYVEPEKLRNRRALVVDDNATNRRILELMLTHWGMKATAVDGGQSAVAALDRAYQAGEPFDLLLSDCHMPEMDGFMLVEEIKKKPELTGLIVMMLTSGGRRGDASRCRALGVSAYLTKPVQHWELQETLLSVLGLETRAAERTQLVTRHALRESRRALRVLLAEDNVVNQQLAVRLLEKRGHTAVVAADGLQALAALETQKFDLVLMDVQMPEMDGVEATRAIREKEKKAGTHIPIVAMTAHAMMGDRERFLSAGMDGYVSKPVRSQELFDTLEALLRPHAETAQAAPNERPAAQSTIDLSEALAQVDGDANLLRHLAGLFLQDSPKLQNEIQSAFRRQDPQALERAAHTLKGSVSNFCAKGVFEAALDLETSAHRGDLAAADKAFRSLEKELAVLKPALETLGKQLTLTQS